MKKETKAEIQNFAMLFLAAVLGMWFVAASTVAVFWLIGLI